MTETAATREKTRKVKNHILDRYLKLAYKVDEEGKDNLTRAELLEYEKRSDQFASNCVPRSTEVTGEEGGALLIRFDRVFNESNATQETTGDSPEQS